MAKRDSNDNPKPTKTLRQRAEELLRAKPADVGGMSPEDVQALVHELQVHQMELEIQNEELRQAQLELAESRDRYADLYEFAPVGYLSLDREGVVRAANLAAASIVAVDRDELVGEKFSTFIRPESQDDWFLHRRNAFDGGGRQIDELALRTPSGLSLWVRVESELRDHGPVGDAECRTALVDVTARRRGEQALRAINAELQERAAKTDAELLDRIHEVALLAKAVDNLGEGVLITGDKLDWPGPKVVFVNKAMCRITGYGADELIGNTPRILQGEQTDSDTMDAMKRELSAGRRFSCEVTNYRKDGTPYAAELFIAPLFNAEGKRTNFVSVHRDVTERRRTAEALRESEERFRLFMDNSPTIAWMKDAQGRYVYLSRTFEERFAVRISDWRGKTDFDLWPRDFAEQFDKHDREVLASNTVVETVEQAPNPDGTTSDWRVFKVPFTDSRGARFVGGIAAEITEQIRAQRALHESKERLRAILDAAADAIVTIDRRGVIEGVNAATETMFGYLRDELVGRNVNMLMPPPYCDEHDGYIARYLETGEPRIIGIGGELAGRRKDGSVFPVDLSISEIEHLGLFAGIIRDISERKAEQERLVQSERLAALGEAMAGLTHESRNALARSQASLRRLARRVKDTEELSQLAEEALRANDDIRKQFEEVRDYAAPVFVGRETVDLRDVIRAAWDELSDERDGDSAELRVEPAGFDLHCPGDKYSLRHAFRNVLENALAAADPVEIDIRFAEAQIESLPALRISIRDNGPGFPPGVRERAFDAFFTTKTRGTGLGLAIVKRNVEAHGGRVAIGSGKGRGAEILITLPGSQP